VSVQVDLREGFVQGSPFGGRRARFSAGHCVRETESELGFGCLNALYRWWAFIVEEMLSDRIDRLSSNCQRRPWSSG